MVTVFAYFTAVLAEFPQLLSDKDRCLYEATIQGNVPLMKLFLDNGACKDGPKSCRISSIPLIVAIQYGKLNSAEFLLQKGANINIKGSCGTTLVTKACFGFSPTKNLQMVDLLIKYGASVNTAGPEVFEHCHLDLLEPLLDRGVDANVLIRHKSSIVFRAIEYNNKSVLELLLKHGINITECLRNVTKIESQSFLCKESSIDILYWLHSTGATLPPDFLYIAVQQNSPIKFLSWLQSTGATIPQERLFSAVQNSSTEILSWLQSTGAMIPSAILPIAMQQNNIGKVMWILNNVIHLNIDAKYNEYTALYYACMNENERLVEILLKRGANPNMQVDGEPAILLHNVWSRTIFNLLVDYKADVNIGILYNNYGTKVYKLLLHSIMDSYDTFRVEKLIKAGAVLGDFVETDETGKETRTNIWKYAKRCSPPIQKCVAIPHSPETHKSFPPQFLRIVVLFLLANKSNNWRFDNSLIHKIFSYDWS
eukprot:Phypoly_transcript_06867.p1 GENE.Phypoly_transcript_06867~~Phypoly_transcript_06867.p1  ORF type:complete len:482 (-),score=28.27 Phypoly_transcript_06867:138-1583(-)